MAEKDEKLGGFISIQDKDGSMKAMIEQQRASYQKEHPEIPVTFSDIVRLVMRTGCNTLDERKPKKLSDKQKTGALRK